MKDTNLIQKTISIAIATYNGEKYLVPLLDSLFLQTLQPTEVVVVDDCSVDSTITIFKEYAQRYPIKIYQNEINLGVNKNFEKAVSLCSGDYILLCDQDDIWFPNNIKTKIETLEKMPKNEPAFVGSRSVLVNNKLKKIMSFSKRKDDSNPLTIWLTPYQGTTIAMNRQLVELLPKWPGSFKNFPYDSFIRIVAVLTANVYGLAKPLMYYRYHGDNVDLKINERLNIFKMKWLTLLLQQGLSIKRIARLKVVIKQIPRNQIIDSRWILFSKIIECLESNKISWKKFFSIKEINFSEKIWIWGASALNALKNKLKGNSNH